VAESAVEILLALNRCLAFLFAPRNVGDRLFGGWRVWAWLSLPLVYGLYVTVFQKTVAFNGTVFAWMFYPHQGYADQGQFGDVVGAVPNNSFV
jgi:hypothetical protein